MKYLMKILLFYSRVKKTLTSFMFLSLIPNKGKKCKLGINARINNPEAIELGNNVRIGDFVWLNIKFNGDNDFSLKIGNNTYLGSNIQINAWSDVIIEDDCLIADRVYISDSEHTFLDKKIPIKNQGDHFKGRVLIKEGAWIGINVSILPGVKIGKGAIVGANSLVNKDVPDFAIVGGVPARIITFRN